jgi:hypothetical protein
MSPRSILMAGMAVLVAGDLVLAYGTSLMWVFAGVGL